VGHELMIINPLYCGSWENVEYVHSGVFRVILRYCTSRPTQTLGNFIFP